MVAANAKNTIMPYTQKHHLIHTAQICFKNETYSLKLNVQHVLFFCILGNTYLYKIVCSVNVSLEFFPPSCLTYGNTQAVKILTM